MKKLCFAIIFGFAGVVGVSGQAVDVTIPPMPCPADKVCVSRAVAEKALVDAETVKAQGAQIEALKKALDDEKDVANKLKIEFAEKSGELTALKQNAVSDRAIIDLLLKQVRKKCMPLSVCF